MIDGKMAFQAHAASDLLDGVFDDLLKVTWMRNPVDRIYSYYLHVLRSRELENGYYREVVESQMSVVEFSNLAWVRNSISRSYCPDLDSYDFVGLLEAPDESCKAFQSLLEDVFDRSLESQLPHLNSYQEHAMSERETLSASDRGAIARANSADMDLYARVCETYGYVS